MSAIERITVDVPPELAAVLRQSVSEGEYASTSEVVLEALREWIRDRDSSRHDLETLREAIRAGDGSGPSIAADEVFRELRAVIADRPA